MAFLISNRKGGYALLAEKPFSRYAGVFFREQDRLFKAIEDIAVDDKFIRITSNFWAIERTFKRVQQRFFMPLGFNALAYESSSKAEVEIILDVREPYDNRQYGRYYSIAEESGCIVITFTKKTDSKEDKSHDAEEYKAFIVVRAEKPGYAKTEQWHENQYSLDEQRGSYPSQRFVFSALKLKTAKFAAAFSLDKDKALHDASFVLENMENLKKIEEHHHKTLTSTSKKGDTARAYRHAVVSLDQLTLRRGIYAGLPWFFQFWARDEAVCLKALYLIKRRVTAKAILLRLLSTVQADGNIPNRIPSTNLGCADAIGWACKRARDLMEKGLFVAQERRFIEKKLGYAIMRLLKFHTQNSLAMNGAQETWMDTNHGGDDRKGARIEIQAMRLLLYKLMYELTGKKVYRDLELRLHKKARALLWNGKILSDGFQDSTARPNIFIAHYIYPKLLSKAEWKICFENTLKEIWLEWGGLATISKDHPLFQNTHTGENPQSYHRGDSWFWINNLAALCMHRVDKKAFKPYIDKILEASTTEILEMGIIGSHAELSSAIELGSEGCLSQAWSLAMFVEMVQEVK